MPRSMQLNLPPALVSTVDGGASTACRAEVNSLDVPPTQLLRDAVESSGCQHKEAAISAGYNADYWTRVLSGERGIHLDRLGRLPPQVQRTFVQKWARQLRMTVTDADEKTAAVAELAEAAIRALKLLVG